VINVKIFIKKRLTSIFFITLIIGASLTLTIVLIKQTESKNPFVVKIEEAFTGSFFFENKTTIHLPYRATYGNKHVGWLIINKNDKNELKIENHLDPLEYTRRDAEVQRRLRGGISYSKWYYLFANGMDSLFWPRVIGQRTRTFDEWEPAPTFRKGTSANNLTYFINIKNNSTNSLLGCFLRYWVSSKNSSSIYFSFYFYLIDNDLLLLDNITYSKELYNYYNAYFSLYNDQPVILWNWINSSINRKVLTCTIKDKNMKWCNYTVSIPNQQLYPCGFDVQNNELILFFFGHHFSDDNPFEYTATTFYSATINGTNLQYNSLFSLPSVLYFDDQSIYRWKNGSLSLLFKEHNITEHRIKSYYGLYSNGDLSLHLLQFNSYNIDVESLQISVYDDRVYLLWKEYFRQFKDYKSIANYTLYFASFHENDSFSTIFTLYDKNIITVPPINSYYLFFCCFHHQVKKKIIL